MTDSDSDTASSVGSIVEEASEPDDASIECLFCREHWPSAPQMFDHCRAQHDFDITSTISSLGPDIDELTIIKLINYLRRQTKLGIHPRRIEISAVLLSDDEWLQPALEDDALLFELGDLMPDPDTKAVDYDQFEAALHDRIGQDVEKIDLRHDRDVSYFDSYRGAGIHREMIEDRVRTEGYRDFVEKNAELFKGKTVLDVGCGTGILSMFCARAGAKKVFAVDNSGIALRAREIIEKNGFSKVIDQIQGRVEDFNTQRLIGKDKVDIIISEWMGYGLLFEGMLDSVLKARDLYLKEDGLMVPSHCTLRIAPVSDEDWIAQSKGETFWKDVYGFDFSPMVPGGLLNHHDIGVFDVPAKAVSGNACTFHQLDLKRLQIRDLDFTVPFESALDADRASIDAFVIWFDAFLLPQGGSQDARSIDVSNWETNGHPGVGFSTGPFSTATHWHQAVLLLDEADRVKQVSGASVIRGTVTYRKNKSDVRGIDVAIVWEAIRDGHSISGTLKRTMA